MRTAALQNLDGGNVFISIHRMHIVEKLLKLYSDPTFCRKVPKFSFEGEFTDDEDGPKREVYNLFWEQIFKMNFEGGGSVVPILGPDMSENLVTILGRIAVHGYICCGFFPTQISQVFLKAVLFWPLFC